MRRMGRRRKEDDPGVRRPACNGPDLPARGMRKAVASGEGIYLPEVP